MKRNFLRTGGIAISTSPALITTVLGSCVSVCLWDPRKGIGGINHFKAPHPPRNRPNSNVYGNMAIPVLIEKMLKKGSCKSDLRAMLFGGGSVTPVVKGVDPIGAANIQFAEELLGKEKIRIVSRHTGRNFGRRVTFDTSNGTASIVRIKPVATKTPLKPRRKG